MKYTVLKKLGVIGPKWGKALLPACCLICKQTTDEGLCACCDAQYFGIPPHHRCVCCALPFAHSMIFSRSNADPLDISGNVQCPEMPIFPPLLCGACLADPPRFDLTLTLGDYAGVLSGLALGLKFHARLAVAHEWARRLACVIRTTWPINTWPDLIVPVPLSRKRLSERGYNQAWEIARPLARALGVPAQPCLLKRIRDTAPQTHLSAEARRTNLSKAFTRTALPFPIHCQHIAVVDDVMTSGTTLEALATLLKSIGVTRISNLVALRTPKNYQKGYRQERP